MSVREPGRYVLEAIAVTRHGDIANTDAYDSPVAFRLHFRHERTAAKAAVLLINEVSEKYGTGYLNVSKQLLEQLCYATGENHAKLQFLKVEKTFRNYIGEIFYLTFASTSVQNFDRVASIGPAVKEVAPPNPYRWTFWGKVAEIIGKILSIFLTARSARNQRTIKEKIDGV